MKETIKKFKPFWTPALLLMGLMLFTNSCQEEKFELPVVHTGEIVEITPDGVIFHGKIIEQGNNKIIDHGFVWGLNTNLNLENSTKKSLGPLPEAIFETAIDEGLKAGETYYVRAFARTENTIIYGRIVGFYSQGSKTPMITKFQPESGVWGDTITIWGGNLGQNSQDIHPFVGPYECPIIHFSGDSLQIIIPEELADTMAEISIQLFDDHVFANSLFAVDPPEVFEFAPEEGIYDTPIDIHGRGFHPQKTYNKVFLGQTELEILTNSPTRLEVQLPEGISHGEHFLRVVTLRREASSQNPYMLYQPWKRLGDFPFHREFIGNGFQVGESAYQFGYDQTNYSLILWEFRQDTETWTQKGPAPFSAPSSTFSTLTKGYVLDGKQLFQYDPTTNQWVQKASWILPFNYMDELSCFSTEQHLYICGGRRGYNYYNTFYQYDELTNTWTTRKNFPEQAIFNATAFSILEKGYIALGQIGYYEPNLSIYEYNPATNNWTIKTSFQGILINDQSGRQGGRVFVINEKAFLFGGTQILSPAPNNRKDFYEFNSTTNSLKRLPDLPFEINYFPSTFSINGKGYILGNNVSNEVWEFDPEKQAPWLK